MLTRAITGLFFIIVLIGALLLGEVVFTLFFSLVGLGALYEFYGIVKSEANKPNVWLGMLSALTLAILIGLHCIGYIPFKYVWLFIPMISLIFIVSLYQKRALPFNDIGYTLLGIMYACIPFLFFVALGFISGTFNHYIPLGFLIILWANDTGAYLSGRSFGKHKLFERISPNKTWQGFIGGVLFAMLIALNLEQYFGSLAKWEWVTMATIIGIFGTLGDLVESMLKRSLNVKDSGNILPGHGGLLDRFDGLLIAAPLVFLFLLMLQ
ncbi:phosphatidate cytidylyltransferase [Sphingobacterium alimentarium]|jgi:phosphatidate cytidylyltransferase|uniref:Phosphatidate cytidylyltransferase n=1 Tax=Sphingobacterium alimentarium TaxID=797292 RepID=A0A4R3VSV1_9SPHI|nr:phosphatidate cytidylyltransferase [Sphingobacterium alimentarium]TCV12906.1 phosphatidate cytidylyltransferase [Sphingobacterium alimentarium]